MPRGFAEAPLGRRTQQRAGWTGDAATCHSSLALLSFVRMADARGRNRTLVLDGEACVRARRSLGLSREALSERAVGPHPLSVATLKRAESGQPVYLETARRIAELLSLPLSALAKADLVRREGDALDFVPPAVSVLPFRWLGEDPAGGHLASGLTDDLLTRLAHFWFPVVAPNALERLNDGVDPVALRSALNVRYWVEGSVRRSGSKVRVVSHLVHGESGRILWTQTFDRAIDEVLRFQEELASCIVAEVGATILDLEARRAREVRSPQASAWELSLLGAWYFQRQDKTANARARALLSQALEADAGLPLAWYTLAMTHRLDIINRWTSNQGDSLRALHQVGVRYAELHPLDPGHHVVAAYVQVLLGQRDGVKPRVEEALALDPNHPTAYSLLGQALAFNGHGDAAIEQFEMALRLRPVSVENWQPLVGMALAHVVAERYEDSIHWTHQACALRPDMPIPLATLAVARAHLNDLRGAAEAVAQLRTIDRNINIGSFQALGRSSTPDIAARFFDGLRLAGLTD